MMRYLLDTGIMGDLINRRRGVDVQAQGARSRGAIIGTCEPVVAELFFGVENSSTRDPNRKRLQRALRGIRCWPLDRRASEEYGRLAAESSLSGTGKGGPRRSVRRYNTIPRSFPQNPGVTPRPT